MKAIEQYFHVVLFTMLWKVVLTLEFGYTRETMIQEQHITPENNLHHNHTTLY